MTQLNAICNALDNDVLRQKGEAEIEYANTHPDVKICFADNTICWKCNKNMCSVCGLINGSMISPDVFSDTMLKISRQKGAILEARKSVTTGEYWRLLSA